MTKLIQKRFKLQTPRQNSLSILLAPKLKSYNDMIYFYSQSISMMDQILMYETIQEDSTYLLYYNIFITLLRSKT